jgi:hypothetical protein
MVAQSVASFGGDLDCDKNAFFAGDVVSIKHNNNTLIHWLAIEGNWWCA